MRLKIFLLLTALASFSAVSAQTDFYDLTTIQEIRIYFTSNPDWDYQMDTAKAGSEGYVMADFVIVNGTTFDSVGVKYKGNSSYNSSYEKNPLHIELDSYKNQAYLGIKDIKLGNNYADPSMLREVLAYDILGNYMDCPKSNFARVYINDIYVGLYSNDESIGKSFCSTHFSSSSNMLVKCNPLVTPGPNTKSNLRYINADSTSYQNFYEIKSNDQWSELINLCDTVTNYAANIEEILDIDRAIWMLAFNNLFVNLDSYTGVFCQNYYLYKDNNGRFNPIIWDLNMCFGGFPYVGSSNNSLGSLTIANMQQLTYNIHSADQYWPLIKAVINDPTYKRMYIAHMRTMLNEQIISNNYIQKVNTFQSLISNDVLADTNKFFTDTDFQNSLTQNTQNGSYQIPGISTLMSARASYLQGTAEFTATPPTISSILPSTSAPSLNSNVTITAEIAGANISLAYLGYRFNKADRYTKVIMYDDGAHGDGAAGDGVYGTSFSMSGYRAQYYIYAENAAAGIFSPEAAEYKYYELNAAVPTASAGQIVINEFLPLNQTDTINEFGNYEDWIELYNLTNSPLNMDGIFLSDDSTNLQKYSFPTGTIINANSYLMVWADENSSASTTQNIHCNFKLSGTGEELFLSNLSGQILDSIRYGIATADISFGRCPNGTGSFTALVTTTFAAANCTVGIEDLKENLFTVYPNPANSTCSILMMDNKNHQLILTNQQGQILLEQNFNSTLSLPIQDIAGGIYFVNVDGMVKKLIKL